MKKLLKLVGALFGLFLLVLAGLYGYALTLDAEIDLATEIQIDAHPAAIYPFLATGEGVKGWWDTAASRAAGQGYPAMQVETSGPDGAGLVAEFGAEGSVFETWTLKSARADEFVVYDVDFQIFQVERTIWLTERGAATVVSWRETATIDDPMTRYLTVVMPPEETIANFDMALGVLKEIVEQRENKRASEARER